ncbi:MULTISPECIES: hypothetical protein [Arthrobacter]|uniref:Uncharacterized protein n=1 Tax=Arthrobacter terricola TaxID=2547396 RepID=A0A4R5KBV3_9MICC|nr:MULTISPECIES: hypothetical protein [Arthrobacter]MBT8162785.1 hypothetical protein [Arthrobacter sp. GN70]TDF92055.1 hypothetical protein E1809_18925 [Arthrobacter terricola]
MVAPITEDLMRGIGARLAGTYVDLDGGAGNQCWDSAMWINEKFFGLPRINTWNPPGKAGRWPGWAGNLVDCFPQSDSIGAAYQLLPPGTPGLPGDTVVWGTDNQLWYPKTHVATLVSDGGNGWGYFLSQNSSMARPDLPGYSPDSTGPVIFQTLPFAGCIGIIRPRTTGGSGSINFDSITTTSAEEDDMALTDEQLTRLANVVADTIMTRPITQPNGVVTNLKSVVSEFRGHVTDTIPASILNREIPRGGTMGGKTSLGAMVGWNDEHVIQTIAAVAASAANDSASIDQIKEAVKQAVSESVVKVDVHIEGAAN